MTILVRQGFVVTEAATGESGLAAALGDDIDLITLDLNLFDPNGLEVCRQLRAVSDAYVLTHHRPQR